MITIVDYKVGNLGSIQNMLKKLGVSSVISSDPEIVSNAQKLILPGVGSFDTGVKSLRKHNLWEVLEDKVIKQKTPVLGICLGMQLLCEKSEEGKESGFGWIQADVIRFKPENKQYLNTRILSEFRRVCFSITCTPTQNFILFIHIMFALLTIAL